MQRYELDIDLDADILVDSRELKKKAKLFSLYLRYTLKDNSDVPRPLKVILSDLIPRIIKEGLRFLPKVEDHKKFTEF